MSTIESEEEEGMSSSSAITFLEKAIPPLAAKAGSLAEEARVLVEQEVLPVVQEEYTQWKSGLLKELEAYEKRGNSKTSLVLTILVVFLVAFHVELLILWKQFMSKGGLIDQWSYQWTLYYQYKQRQRRRRMRIKQKKGQKTDQTQIFTRGVQNLASPTSTASTVEESAPSNTAAPTRGTPKRTTSGQRGNIMHMMKNQHKPISPRPSPDTYRKLQVQRDAYGLPTSSHLISPNNSNRSGSMGHGSQASSTLSNSITSSGHNPSNTHASYRLNKSNMLQNESLLTPFTNKSFTDSEHSIDILNSNNKRLTQTTFLLDSSHSQQDLSNSSIASKGSTATPSRTPSERSYATPNPDGTQTPTDRSASSNRTPVDTTRSEAMAQRIKRRATSPHKQKMEPQESAPPMRRSRTYDTAPSNTPKQRNRLKKKHAPSPSGTTLAQARRRMSAGGVNAERAAAAANPAGLQRARTGELQRTRTGEGIARQMHPRSRSGNGAMTSTASQMYMARCKSSKTSGNSVTNNSQSQQQQSAHPRSRSGTGANSSPVPSRQIHPRSKSSGAYNPPRTPPLTPTRRTRSPMRSTTPPNSNYRPRVTRELSRQELGYE